MRRLVRYARGRYWISVIIAAVLPGTIAGVIEYAMTDGVSGWIPVSAAFAGGLATFALLRLVDVNKPNEAHGSSDEAVTPTDRKGSPLKTTVELTPSVLAGKDMSPRTPAELVAEIEGFTQIAAASAVKRHVGLWLPVEGTVVDVSERSFDQTIGVYLRESKDGVTVMLDFDGTRWRAQLSSLNVGDQLAAVGRIEDIHFSGFVNLEECSLL